MIDFTKRRSEKIAVEYNNILEERGVIAASEYLVSQGNTDDVWPAIYAEREERDQWSHLST